MSSIASYLLLREAFKKKKWHQGELWWSQL